MGLVLYADDNNQKLPYVDPYGTIPHLLCGIDRYSPDDTQDTPPKYRIGLGFVAPDYIANGRIFYCPCFRYAPVDWKYKDGVHLKEPGNELLGTQLPKLFVRV